MIEFLRRQANEAAQACLREMIAYQFRTGQRNAVLEARYQAAERLVDWVEDFAASLPDVPLALTPDPGDHFAWPT